MAGDGRLERLFTQASAAPRESPPATRASGSEALGVRCQRAVRGPRRRAAPGGGEGLDSARRRPSRRFARAFGVPARPAGARPRGRAAARPRCPGRHSASTNGAASSRSRAATASDAGVTGEVAAVHGGDVTGLERSEVTRCRTSCRSARGSARAGPSSRAWPRAGPRVSSVPSQPKSRAATVGQQVQTDVGRRGPPGHHRARVFLEVVGRHRVVRGRHERLEEAPASRARRRAERSRPPEPAASAGRARGGN